MAPPPTPPSYSPIIPAAQDTVHDFSANSNAYLHRDHHIHKRLPSTTPPQSSLFASVPRKTQHMIIGVILSNGEVRQDLYRCHTPACAGATFTRLAGLKRHHACRHRDRGGRTPQFWCPVDGCECSRTAFIHLAPSRIVCLLDIPTWLTLLLAEGRRSMNGLGEAFPRKDKMMDHLERVHADKMGF